MKLTHEHVDAIERFLERLEVVLQDLAAGLCVAAFILWAVKP